VKTCSVISGGCSKTRRATARYQKGFNMVPILDD